MNVLIIEDNLEVRQLIRGEVEDLVEDFFEGADGSEALRLYTAHRPDWVLMDLEMKEVNGLTATRQIKAAFPEAQICIVTNFNDDDLRQEAREAGASAFVAKDDLFLLREVMEKRVQATLPNL